MHVEPEELDVLAYIEKHEVVDLSVDVPLEYVAIACQLEEKHWLLNTWTAWTPKGFGSFALTTAGRSVLAWHKLRGSIAGDSLPNESKPRRKPGRKSTRIQDKKIAAEYAEGLDNQLWEGQAHYLREKHPARWKKNKSAAKSWLNSLLKRVKETPDD